MLTRAELTLEIIDQITCRGSIAYFWKQRRQPFPIKSVVERSTTRRSGNISKTAQPTTLNPHLDNSTNLGLGTLPEPTVLSPGMAEEHSPESMSDQASVTVTEQAEAPVSPPSPPEETNDEASTLQKSDEKVKEEVKEEAENEVKETEKEVKEDEEAREDTAPEPEVQLNGGETEAEALTTATLEEPAKAEVSSPEQNDAPTPMPTISLPQESETEPASDADSTQYAKTPSDSSRPSSLHSHQDRDLPQLPEPPASPITQGIPLPIGDSGRPAELSPSRTPEPPVTPTRTSSRNAPTTANPQNRRVTSESLAQNNAAGQVTISSMVFVVQALETIGSSKDSRKRKQLSDAVQKAVDAIRETAPEPPTDPNVVFEPLRLACKTGNSQLATTALDCIGKLISYSYFSVIPLHPEDTKEQEPQPLIERAIETICECFQGDSCPDMVQLQIVKALLAAVLNDKVVVHGAGLLKAIRQTYNIFLLSRNSANQQTAQGTLTQMVHTVFERVKTRLAAKEDYLGKMKNESTSALSVHIPPTDNSSLSSKEEPAAALPIPDVGHERITLQSFENRKSFDDERITDAAPTTVNRAPRKSHPRPSSDGASESAESTQEDEDEVYIKDAFLVFRAMCKLSIKTLPAEQIADLKSHGMRSKLLSLHLIHVIMLNHMDVFVSPQSTIKSSSGGEPTGFIHAVKQYLCLALSRNAASAVGHVFDVCCEIFWLILSNMRVMLKV